MSGKHGGHCAVRGNDGSYSPMPADEVTVGKLLSLKGGYVTGVVGKWGEGDHGTSGYPIGAGGGFDEFIGQDTQVGGLRGATFPPPPTACPPRTVPNRFKQIVCVCDVVE